MVPSDQVDQDQDTIRDSVLSLELPETWNVSDDKGVPAFLSIDSWQQSEAASSLNLLTENHFLI